MSSASIQFAKESRQVARAWLIYNRTERRSETCPVAPRSWHYRERQDIPRHAKSAELVRTTVSDFKPGSPSPHEGDPQMSCLRWGACQSPQNEAARQNLAVAHAVSSPMSKAINKSSIFNMGSLVSACPRQLYNASESFLVPELVVEKCRCRSVLGFFPPLRVPRPILLAIQ